MTHSGGCGYAACAVRRGNMAGGCRCFGASPLCKGGYQDARLQLAEAARQLDATEAERDEWKAMTKVADRALARLARLAAFAIEHGGSGRTVEAHRAWRLATRTFGKLAALGVARRGR